MAGGKVAFVPNGSNDLWLATVRVANSGAVLRSSIDSGPNVATAMDPSGGRQFVVNESSPHASFSIRYCNAVQCSGVDTVTSSTLPGQIVASATDAYWADRTTGGSAYSYQSGMVSTVIPASYKPDFVAIDSSYLYWVDTGLSNIDRMPLAGGAVQVVVPAAPSAITGLATDGKYVYYSLQGGNTLSALFAPVAGGATPVTIFTQGGTSVLDIRTAGGFVSWVAGGGYPTIYGARTPL